GFTSTRISTSMHSRPTRRTSSRGRSTPCSSKGPRDRQAIPWRSRDVCLTLARARSYVPWPMEPRARAVTRSAVVRGGRAMKKLGIVVALLVAVVILLPPPALAQVKGLYWTTSGYFGPFPITDLIPTVPKEKQRDVTIPVSMWVIDHPKGLVVFDT